MKKSRSIVGIAVVVSSVVLIAAGVLARRAIEQLSATGDAVLRAKEIELDYERLLSTIRDAETGQRGYLLTNDELYLAPYERALRELRHRMETVESHILADGESVTDLAPLRSLVTRRLEVIAETIELNRAGSHREAVQVVRSAEGKRLMDEIRAFIGAKVVERQTRVVRLQEVHEDALTATVRTSLIVSALAIVLVFLLVYIVRRDSVRVRA